MSASPIRSLLNVLLLCVTGKLPRVWMKLGPYTSLMLLMSRADASHTADTYGRSVFKEPLKCYRDL